MSFVYDKDQNKFFWNVLLGRRSVRSYQETMIEDEVIKKIFTAAFVAPRGSQEKSWDLIVVKNHDFKLKLKQIVEDKVTELLSKIKKEKLAKLFKSYSAFFTFFTKAPVLLVVTEKEYNSILVKILRSIETAEYMDNLTMVGRQNVSAAIQNILLACQAEGIGSCWMTGPMIAQEELKKEFGLKKDEKIAAFIPIGYLKVSPSPNKYPEDKDMNFRVI